MEINNCITKTEFMRKERFERMKDKFESVSEEAKSIINNASPDDVLALKLKVNSPIVIENAEIYNEDKFLEQLFGN